MTGSCNHWQAASCQVRGSGHQRTGIPSQDRALAWLRPRPALCVLDGRGSAPLSHLGAQAASQALRAVIRRSEPQLVRILDSGSDALAALGWHGFAHRLYHTAALTQLKLAAQHDRVAADFEFTLSVAVVSGSKSSGSTDGGTSSRVFGSFLSWMQEKDQPVFVVATANDVSQLPPEFLRKGRFDELFFVDLPDAAERAQIWDIVIKRHGRKPTDFDTVVLARACEQFTGAEIEAVFIDALHEAFADGREPLPKDILAAMTTTVPLANLMDGQIGALRHWAKGRAREAAARSAAPARNARRIGEAN